MYTLIDNKNMGSGIPCFRRATTKSAPATTKSALTTTVHRARAWAQGVHAHQNGSDEVARVAQGARGQDFRHACQHSQVCYAVSAVARESVQSLLKVYTLSMFF